MTDAETCGGPIVDHPAVRAWLRVARPSSLPRRIEVLKPAVRKSAVYRLVGVGPGGAAVILKRCRSSTASVERAVYEEVLPAVPVWQFAFHGFVVDEDPEFAWLALEDTGGEPYAAQNKTHRESAARWLGQVHLWTSRTEATYQLPERGLEHGLDLLHAARNTIRRVLANPACKKSDRCVLENLVSRCDDLESNWSAFEQRCAGMPSTLVHGDLGARNVRVRTGSSGPEVAVFDWERGGCGVPALDLPYVDLEVYLAIVREAWPDLSAAQLRGVAGMASAMWCLVAIPPEEASLASPWNDRVMRKMRAYAAELAAVAATEWCG